MCKAKKKKKKVQVQGLCSVHHNHIRHYRRVKRIVMQLHVSMLSPINPLPGMGGGVDSSCKHAISPMGGGFELSMCDSDSTCLFYKMVNVSNPHTCPHWPHMMVRI